MVLVCLVFLVVRGEEKNITSFRSIPNMGTLTWILHITSTINDLLGYSLSLSNGWTAVGDSIPVHLKTYKPDLISGHRSLLHFPNLRTTWKYIYIEDIYVYAYRASLNPIETRVRTDEMLSHKREHGTSNTRIL